jgi:hypothetical protein
MQKMADYSGGFLNHMEGIYRPGDKALAVELAEALGLAVSEIRFTENSRPLVAVHPNAEDTDPTNNVVFLYEMPKVQSDVLELMERRMVDDAEFREVMTNYRNAARETPAIMPHFGLRYASDEKLEKVMGTLAALSPPLKDRVSVWEVPPYQPIAGLPDIRQVFVCTDVFMVGSAGLDQVIELQVDRDKIG